MTQTSVVIPVYNHGETVKEAIGSVLNQTYENIEIIVVNDASTDNTAEEVKNISDNRVRYFEHSRNKGGSAARNTGIKHANGEYISFLDADDKWLPRKLECQVAEIESRSSEWSAVHCDRKREIGITDTIGHTLSKLVGPRDDSPKEGGEELIKEILMMNLSTGASTLLLRADTVNGIGGFNPAFPRHQDWEFLIRILQQGKLAHVDKQLVVKHGTGRPNAAVHEGAKELLLWTFRDEIDRLEEQGYSVTQQQMTHLAKMYFEDGEFETGWDTLPVSSLSLPHLLSVVWSVAFGIKNEITRL